MDAVWTPIAEAVLGPVLGSLTSEFESLEGTDNPPNSGGSSFGGGWYGYVYKDLREELGNCRSRSRTAASTAAAAASTACRASLWAAIQHGAEELESCAGLEHERLAGARCADQFPPDPLAHFTMSWTNRSTFQQAIEFSGHAE